MKEQVTIVIACAGSKATDAGYWTTDEGKKVRFVARPGKAQTEGDVICARPDDTDEHSGKTWRALLRDYNCQWRGKGDNDRGLLPAYRLYSRSIYGDLVDKYGVERVFILSAGWGLIRSDFLTPQYNITFAGGAGCSRRKQSEWYDDCNEMPDSPGEKIYLFAGLAYHKLFCRLIQGKGGERIVFYRSQEIPSCPGCRMKYYATKAQTNWHYVCARDFMNGKITC
ncbi:MAG: hypothetical protein OXR07_09425 [Nitrospira sp.]|nr:hypothetical protein [Nitrospira sp.]